MLVSRCPPQIPHGLAWDWSRAYTVRGQPEPMAGPSLSSDHCFWEWRLPFLGLVNTKLTKTETRHKPNWNYCPKTVIKTRTFSGCVNVLSCLHSADICSELIRHVVLQGKQRRRRLGHMHVCGWLYFLASKIYKQRGEMFLGEAIIV